MSEFTVERIRPYLLNGTMAERIQVFDTIDSTNTEAKRLARLGALEGTTVISNHQTAGRGRLGRSFYSPKDTGIYFSMLLRPSIPLEEAVQVTAAASVAVADAVQNVCGIALCIKWVNDLYYDGKKVCGILTEAVEDAIVIGIGLNCSTVFDGELADIAGSLSVDGDEIRCRLAAELVNRIFKLEDAIVNRTWQKAYKERSMILGKEITVLNEAGSCYLAEDIGDKGELILVDKNGEKKMLTTGEVSIRLHFGVD